MTFEELTGRENKDLIEVDNYLIHKEAVSSFLKLKESAKNEIGADLSIISSYRNHSVQQSIWNAKASGKRTLLDSKGIEIEFNNLSSDELIQSILRWSAIPGASRHHWGSDFDVYDANKISKEKLQLVSSESEPGSPLFEFHQWLDAKLKDSSDFFRPYDEDLGGVNIEKWHLSYAPLSVQYLNEYSIDVFEKNIHASDILLKDVLLKKLEYFYENYVLNISQPLK